MVHVHPPAPARSWPYPAAEAETHRPPGDIVAQQQNYTGEKARDLKLNLAKTMELVFEMEQPVEIRSLYDVISSPAVVAAVVASLTHTAEDEAALLCANLARAGFIDTFTTSDGPMYCSTKRPPPPWGWRLSWLFTACVKLFLPMRFIY